MDERMKEPENNGYDNEPDGFGAVAWGFIALLCVGIVAVGFLAKYLFS